MLTDIVKELNKDQPETVHWFAGEVRVWYDLLTVDFVKDALKADKELYNSLAFSERGKLQGGYQEYLRRAAVIRSSKNGILQRLRETLIGVRSTDVKEIEVCHYKGAFSIQRKHKSILPSNEPLDNSYLDLCSSGGLSNQGIFYRREVDAEKRFKSHFSSYTIDLSLPLLWEKEAECIVGRHNGTKGLIPRLNVEISDIDLYVFLPDDRKSHGN